MFQEFPHPRRGWRDAPREDEGAVARVADEHGPDIAVVEDDDGVPGNGELARRSAARGRYGRPRTFMAPDASTGHVRAEAHGWVAMLAWVMARVLRRQWCSVSAHGGAFAALASRGGEVGVR